MTSGSLDDPYTVGNVYTARSPSGFLRRFKRSDAKPYSQAVDRKRFVRFLTSVRLLIQARSPPAYTTNCRFRIRRIGATQSDVRILSAGPQIGGRAAHVQLVHQWCYDWITFPKQLSKRFVQVHVPSVKSISE